MKTVTLLVLTTMAGCAANTATPDDVCCDGALTESDGAAAVDSTDGDAGVDGNAPSYDSGLGAPDAAGVFDAACVICDAATADDATADATADATTDALVPDAAPGVPDATSTLDAADPPDADLPDANPPDPPDAAPPDADPTPDAKPAAWGQPPPANFTVEWEYTGTCAGEPIATNGCFDFRPYTSMTVEALGSTGKWTMWLSNGASLKNFTATIGDFGDEVYFWDVAQAYLRSFNNGGCPWQPSTINFGAHVAEQVSADQLVGEANQIGWTVCYASGSPPGCYHAWRYTATVVP